jgi:phosphonate transport system substrate-binding protein
LDEGVQLATLRIGILPDETEAELYRQYKPLFDYLQKETGLPVEVTVPDSYAELVDLFARGSVDLAYFGGFTFVNVSNHHDAIPLVMRDVDINFTSLFFVKGNSQTRDLTKTGGERFSFGSRQSTSGHLMPRYFMEIEQNIIPEKHFGSVRYSGRHDLTAYWVRDGAVDLGVANSRIIRKMLRDGRLEPQDIQVIWETPPYTDYVWAVHPGVTVKDRARIRQAFLSLSADNPSHTTILANLDAGGFLPASEQDFLDLKGIVNDMEAED